MSGTDSNMSGSRYHAADLELVARLRAGDQTGFNEFFESYFPRLFRFASTRLDGDLDMAREMTQRTLCRAVSRMHTYRGEAALFTWLCQICRSELADHFRRNRREAQRVVSVEDSPTIRAVLESLTADEESGPARSQERSELERLVQVVLDHLPNRYADALEWKYVEELSVQEVAERLGVSQPAAQSILARARRSFRDTLEGAFDLTAQELLEYGHPGAAE